MSCTSCSDADKLYIGDAGVSIIVETCVSISSATVLKMDVQKPNGTVVQWVASPLSANTGETKIYHVLAGGDLDQSGEYFLQAYVDISGVIKRGNKTSFTVHPLFS